MQVDDREVEQKKNNPGSFQGIHAKSFAAFVLPAPGHHLAAPLLNREVNQKHAFGSHHPSGIRDIELGVITCSQVTI